MNQRESAEQMGNTCRQFKQGAWYWIRRRDGSLTPLRFYKLKPEMAGTYSAEFYVGSMTQTFPMSAVVGRAQMPVTQTKRGR